MKSRAPIKAVIFDLDDTLFAESDFVLSGFREVAKYLGRKYNLKSQELFGILKSGFNNGVRGNNLNLLLKEKDLPAGELKKMVAVYRGHEPKIKLYRDAGRLLAILAKDKNIKTALVTDGPVVSQKNKIRKLGLSKVIDALVLSDSLGKKYRKPHPRPFKIALGKLRISAREAIYIADNLKKDFIGAKSLGIFTIRIKRQDGLYKSVKAPQPNRPDLVVTDLIKVLDYVR